MFVTSTLMHHNTFKRINGFASFSMLYNLTFLSKVASKKENAHSQMKAWFRRWWAVRLRWDAEQEGLISSVMPSHLLPLSSCCLWLRQSLSIVAISSLCCWIIFFRAPSRSCCCFCRNSCSWGVREKNSKKQLEDTSYRGTAERLYNLAKSNTSLQHRALRCHITD